MSRRMRRRLGVAPLLVAAFIAPGSVGSATTVPDGWDEVVSGANDEGTLTVYTSVNPPVLRQFEEAFAEAFPEIHLEFLEATSADIVTRVDQEMASGVQGADIVMFTELLWFDGQEAEEGLLSPTGPAAEGWPAEFMRGNVPIVSLEPIGITVNTDLVEGEITGYDDLLTDEFAGGRLGITEVASSFVAAWYDFAEQNYGPDFMERLAALEPAIYRGSGALAQAAGSGEIAATTFGSPTPTYALIDEGAPLEYIIPEPALGTAHGIGVLTDAAHPNAGLVFLDYLMSEEGQTVWHGAGLTASPINVEGSLDPSTIQLWDPEDYPEDVVADITAEWTALFAP